MCFTYGQWLQMNITSNAGESAKSSRPTLRPSGVGRRKSGAGVPSGSIVEFTAAMRGFDHKDTKTQRVPPAALQFRRSLCLCVFVVNFAETLRRSAAYRQVWLHSQP